MIEADQTLPDASPPATKSSECSNYVPVKSETRIGSSCSNSSGSGDDSNSDKLSSSTGSSMSQRSKSMLRPGTARKHTGPHRIMDMLHKQTARKSTCDFFGFGVIKQTARKSTSLFPNRTIKGYARKKTMNPFAFVASPKIENDYAQDFEPILIDEG